MSKVYYGVQPAFSSVIRWANEGDCDRVYDLVLEITGNHYVAEEAASWCENAAIGWTYEHELFVIYIVEDEE